MLAAVLKVNLLTMGLAIPELFEMTSIQNSFPDSRFVISNSFLSVGRDISFGGLDLSQSVYRNIEM